MELTRLLLEQFKRIRRDLPWREERSAYRIWISEVMLQQTTVQQAIPYYHRFLEHFPDLESLARANESEVLTLWQGLGYYGRARRLHACAKELYSRYGGCFPDQYHELLKLPGIGPYTAAAIASLAFHQPVPAIDGNIIRLTARLAGITTPSHTPLFRKEAEQWLKTHMPADCPGDFNEALMETGALICLPRQPLCHNCGLSVVCGAFRSGLQEKLPVKISKKPKSSLHLYSFIIQKDRRIALVRRPGNSLWGGMYDFPYIETSKPLKAGVVSKFEEKYITPLHDSTPVATARFVLTHRVVHCTYLRSETPSGASLPWFDAEELFTRLPLARAARHALKFFQNLLPV